jgi:hypothetical protein
MKKYNKELEIIASNILEQNSEAIGNEDKLNYSTQD